MTDISSLTKFLTTQPDKATIDKMDRKANAEDEIKRRTSADRARRNIKES
jgi:hypothetical protein